MRYFLITVALVAGVFAPATSASGAATDSPPKPPVTGIGIRLVDAPTATADDHRAATYIIDRLAPGSTIDRRVEVSNGTKSSAQVSLYSAAASISDGSFLGAEGHDANELSTWTTIKPSTLTLAPREKAMAHVIVNVPPDAAPGESYGVVWAEMTTPPSEASGVTQVSRVGIRLYLSIGPGGAPPSDFDIVSLTAARDADEAPEVRATIRNTGGRALDLSGSLTLSKGPGGLTAGPFPVTLGTTLGIDQSEPISVSLNQQLPNGPWLATLSVKSGLTERTAHATITFPTGPGVGATTAAQTGSGVPWSLIVAGLVALLLLLVALLWYFAKRRRRLEPDSTSQQLKPHQVVG